MEVVRTIAQTHELALVRATEARTTPARELVAFMHATTRERRVARDLEIAAITRARDMGPVMRPVMWPVTMRSVTTACEGHSMRTGRS